MNTQYQPEWEELGRRKRKNIKSKKSASRMILVGVITIMITFAAIFLLAILTNFGDSRYSLGAATGICSTITIAVGFVGVLFLGIGYWRQANANYELGEIEKEKLAVRLQIVADERNN